MGDRTYTFYPCPKCGKEIEKYDAPSCLLWINMCESCGWSDGLSYYEGPGNSLWLITEKQARSKKLIMPCPKCKKRMTWWEQKDYGKCVLCFQKDKSKKLKKLSTEGHLTRKKK